jgi:TolB-like protein
MSGDPDQEYFADGMVEEIIGIATRLQKRLKHEGFCRFRWQGAARW